jgi:hypothetical protein
VPKIESDLRGFGLVPTTGAVRAAGKGTAPWRLYCFDVGVSKPAQT